MLADDIIKRADNLKMQRAPFERLWWDIASFALPAAPGLLLYDTWRGSGTRVQGPATSGRVEEIYDSTAVYALRRIAAGIESLIMPQSETWHNLVVDDYFGFDTPHHWEEWLERFRDYQFKARYNPKTGFAFANQQALKQSVAFGVGLYKVIDAKGLDHRHPFSYRAIPLGSAYLDVNEEGQLDTVYERRSLTARQIVNRWKDTASDKIKAAANDVSRKDDLFEIIVATQPREEIGSRASGLNNRNSDYASYTIEVDTKHTLEDSGFYTFPYVDYAWERDPGQAYAVSPMMLALPDTKSVNVMGQSELLVGQQMAQPAFGTTHEAVSQIDLGPYAINPGLVSEKGDLMLKPLIPAQNPSYMAQLIERRQASIKDALFVNLFQVLVENPQMTATEALIRADEKGQLLGPVGSNIQNGAARLIDREVDILQQRGAFDEGSQLAPPEDFEGTSFKPEFQGPLVRARRSGELLGIQRTFELLAPLAELKPEIFMQFDFDEIPRIVAEISGAPKSIMLGEDEIAALKEKAAEAQQMQEASQGIGLAQQGAEAVSAGAEASIGSMDAINGADQLIQQIAGRMPGGAAQGLVAANEA